MKAGRIAKGLVVLNLAALVATVVAAWLTGTRANSELLDLAMYVALGMGALGALTFGGATTGSNGSAEIAASAAEEPSKLMSALWTDRDAGISAGAMLVLGGLSWLCTAWLVAEMLPDPLF